VGGAAVFTFWQRSAYGLPAPEHFVDRLAAERVADRDPAHPPILIDAQSAPVRCRPCQRSGTAKSPLN
jgi:hypothetical protein